MTFVLSDNMLRLTYEYSPYGLYHDSMKEEYYPRDAVEYCYGQQDKCSGLHLSKYLLELHN